MQQIKSEAATVQVAVGGRMALPDGPAGAHRRVPGRRRDLAFAVRRLDFRPGTWAGDRDAFAYGRRRWALSDGADRSRTPSCSSSTSTSCASATPRGRSRRKGSGLPFGKGRIARPGTESDHCHLWRHRRAFLAGGRRNRGQRRSHRPALGHAVGQGAGGRVRRTDREVCWWFPRTT